MSLLLAAISTASFVVGGAVGVANSTRIRSLIAFGGRRPAVAAERAVSETPPVASAALAFEAAAQFADESGRPEHVDAYAHALMSLADVPSTLRTKHGRRSWPRS
jgi:hypothetical protein